MSTSRKFSLNIFQKILIGYLLIPVLPLLGLLYLIYTGQIERTENVENQLKYQALSVSNDISRWAEMNLKVLKQNSMNQDIRSMEEAKQKPILENILNTYDWTYLVYAIGGDGYKTARSDNRAIFKKDGSKAHYRGDRNYYKQIIDGNPHGQQVVISRTIGGPAYVLCVPIETADGEDNALCMASELANISENVTSTQIGESGFAFLTDNKNNLIAHGGNFPEIKDKLTSFSKHPAIANGKVDSTALYEYEGQKIVSYTTDTGLGWKLTVQQDYNEAYRELKVAQKNAVILLILTIVLTLIFAIMLSRGLSLPIQKLTLIANGYSKGKFNIAIPGLDRGDEIGNLARAIQRMGKSIRIAIKKLQQKR